MTTSDTIVRVARPRKALSAETLQVLGSSRDLLRSAEDLYRQDVLDALSEGSFNEVSKATGLSKDTLQRWKREAGK